MLQLGNGSDGIRLLKCSDGTIGGTTADAANVISGNGGFGIAITGSNSVDCISIQGNRIGTDLTGSSPLGNQGGGIQIASSSLNSVTGNVISANGGIGISLAGANGSLVTGDMIGTDNNGLGTSGGFGNRDDGIRVLNSTDSVYDLQLVDWEDGSDVPTSGCNVVIVGTDNNGVLHIKIFDAAGKLVTDADETMLLSQAGAISTLKQLLLGFELLPVLTDAQKAQVITEATSIVGLSPDSGRVHVVISGNVVSNSEGVGIRLTNGSGVRISGNKIGIDASGNLARNGSDGISLLNSSNCTIGGTANVISGNGGSGISLTRSSVITISENDIGTNATGSLPLGNQSDGIRLENSNNNIIGPGNVISGNATHGVRISGKMHPATASSAI